MNNGQVFRDLAYAALCREEEELGRLWRENPSRRPLSVAIAGETAVDFMILKEAVRDGKYPRVLFEVPYQDSRRKKVDVCFVDTAYRPYTSFELKKFADFEPGWKGLFRDIEKHLAPGVRIEGASDGAERYSALLLITEDEKSKEELEDMVAKKVGHLLRDPVFYTSDAVIELNRVESTNSNAHRWSFLRVVVFTGTYVESNRAVKKTA